MAAVTASEATTAASRFGLRLQPGLFMKIGGMLLLHVQLKPHEHA